MGLPNYVNNWRRLGFTDLTLREAARTAWSTRSSPGATKKRFVNGSTQHWQAGADHVCVQAIGAGGRPDERLLQVLASHAWIGRRRLVEYDPHEYSRS